MRDVPHGRLVGWKEIAEHLHVDSRTAQRWAKERGLPVRHVPGGKRPTVVADPGELDRWELGESPKARRPTLATSPVSMNRVHAPGSTVRHRRLPYVLVAAGLVVVAIDVAVLELRAPKDVPISQVTFEGQAIVAKAGGKELWWHDFGQPFRSELTQAQLQDKVRIEDLHNDGLREVLVAAPLLRQEAGDLSTSTDELYCFSSRGKTLWHYRFPERVRFGDQGQTSQWEVGALMITSGRLSKSIWCAICSYPWSSSVLLRFDAQGHPTRHFVNFGHIRSLSEVHTSKGSYVLAGGINNEYDCAMLAVLKEAQASGHSPQTPGTLSQWEGSPPGEPDRYFLFPRTEVSQVIGPPYNCVTNIEVAGSRAEVVTTEVNTPPDTPPQDWALYDLSENFEPKKVFLSDHYWDDHRKLGEEGRIRHTVETCPERIQSITVRMWTPQGGWRQIHLPPICLRRRKG